ncbi:hypothetical protein Agabi119p4_2591 [Agaricus bisporus var. burnettii]|uniref:Uncharacterized protein n=1 Tax=Agaricus bisporus var. burnettii TaxID=192524 RepID=A0A8H7F9D4_AGABI|nr:hypothetical protein Agabi119p4_2591 [Agaricus bisporus var. burnettii]
MSSSPLSVKGSIRTRGFEAFWSLESPRNVTATPRLSGVYFVITTIPLWPNAGRTKREQGSLLAQQLHANVTAQQLLLCGHHCIVQAASAI